MIKIKKLSPILSFCFIYSVLIYPQDYFISGQITDSTFNSLKGANIRLVSLPDSSTKGITSDNNGKFIFINIPSGHYLLKVSFIGYSTFLKQIEIKSESIDLGIICLSVSPIQIGEVEIVDKLPSVVVKKDTIEFFSDAFKTTSDATAEELVKKMPGVSVGDGKIKAQGEEVKKVLVDGKPFLSETAKGTLKKMPAEMIEKVQLFEKKSEEADMSGIDDGTRDKTFNLITRKKFKNGTFGKISGGYGSNKRYFADINLNNFRDYRRIGITGQINNMNRLLDFDNAPGGMMLYGLPINNSGIEKYKSFRVFYMDALGDKIDFNGGYSFNSSNKEMESSVERSYTNIDINEQQYSEINNSAASSMTHNINFKLSAKLDSTSFIILTPSISFNQSKRNSLTNGLTTLLSNPVNSISKNSSDKLIGFNSGVNLKGKKNFSKSGRSITSSITAVFRKNTANKNLFSANNYYGDAFISDTLNQLSNQKDKNYHVIAKLSYNEPIDSFNSIQLRAEFSSKKNISDDISFNIYQNGKELDSLSSSVYDNNYQEGIITAGYKFVSENLSINTLVNYAYSMLENRQSLPAFSNVKHYFNFIRPTLNISYQLFEAALLEFYYQIQNYVPVASQLQTTVDYSNPINLRTGNPDLKKGITHLLSLSLISENWEGGGFFRINVNADFHENMIAFNHVLAFSDTTIQNRIFLKKGSRINYPINLDGGRSFNSYAVYVLPIDALKSNLNLEISFRASRKPVILNNQQSFSNTKSLDLSYSVTSNISPQVDFTLSGSSRFNQRRNELFGQENNYFTQFSAVQLNLFLFESLKLNGDITHRYESNLPVGFDKNKFIVNAGVGYKIFKDKSGEFRFNAYNIFNQISNVNRSAGDIFIEDTQTNILGRYFIFSFIYNIKYF